MEYIRLSQKMITSANDLPGVVIVENHGIVRGIVVRSNSIVGNIFGGIRSIFGGNISVFSDMCDRARQDAFDRMIEHANEMGANAVIGFRYDATELAQGITEVLAYGTAVTVEQK